MRRENGFTLVELLVVIMLSAVLMTLGASALRHYWLLHSVTGASEEVVSQLRQLQEQTVAESHPLVYGAWFKAGQGQTSSWGRLKYDPKDVSTSSDDTCVQVGSGKSFSNDVYIESVTFDDVAPATALCASAAPAGSEIALFFARGNATGGQIVLTQPNVDRSETVEVLENTGRAERL